MNKITEKDLIPASKYLSNDAPVPENFVPAQEFLSKEEFNIPENFVPAQNFLSGDYTLSEKKEVSDRPATKLDFVEEPELDTSTHQPQFPQSQEFKETVEKQDIGKSESIPGFEYNKEEYPYGIPIPGARKIGFGTERVVEGLDTTAALVTGGLTGAIGTDLIPNIYLSPLPEKSGSRGNSSFKILFSDDISWRKQKAIGSVAKSRVYFTRINEKLI
jgi:hypothetical protein